MKSHWWDIIYNYCTQANRIVLDAAKLLFSLLMMAVVLFSSLFIYWLFFDNSPVVLYGNNANKEFVGNHIIVDVDSTRLRPCETTIHRKIGGCGQINLESTFAITPVGKKAPPISIPMAIIYDAFPIEKLSGSVCTLVSRAESYCNPAQRLLKMPIIAESPPISFIPVPRMKTYPTNERDNH